MPQRATTKPCQVGCLLSLFGTLIVMAVLGSVQQSNTPPGALNIPPPHNRLPSPPPPQDGSAHATPECASIKSSTNMSLDLPQWAKHFHIQNTAASTSFTKQLANAYRAKCSSSSPPCEITVGGTGQDVEIPLFKLLEGYVDADQMRFNRIGTGAIYDMQMKKSNGIKSIGSYFDFPLISRLHELVCAVDGCSDTDCFATVLFDESFQKTISVDYQECDALEFKLHEFTSDVYVFIDALNNRTSSRVRQLLETPSNRRALQDVTAPPLPPSSAPSQQEFNIVSQFDPRCKRTAASGVDEYCGFYPYPPCPQSLSTTCYGNKVILNYILQEAGSLPSTSPRYCGINASPLYRCMSSYSQCGMVTFTSDLENPAYGFYVAGVGDNSNSSSQFYAFLNHILTGGPVASSPDVYSPSAAVGIAENSKVRSYVAVNSNTGRKESCRKVTDTHCTLSEVVMDGMTLVNQKTTVQMLPCNRHCASDSDNYMWEGHRMRDLCNAGGSSNNQFNYIHAFCRNCDVASENEAWYRDRPCCEVDSFLRNQLKSTLTGGSGRKRKEYSAGASTARRALRTIKRGRMLSGPKVTINEKETDAFVCAKKENFLIESLRISYCDDPQHSKCPSVEQCRRYHKYTNLRMQDYATLCYCVEP
jgi:hypothetical protein